MWPAKAANQLVRQNAKLRCSSAIALFHLGRMVAGKDWIGDRSPITAFLTNQIQSSWFRVLLT
jgi:hypothetical protein